MIVPAERGRARTRAAEETAAEAAGGWAGLPVEGEVRSPRADLAKFAPYGPVRPVR
ncbi:hypothetical protein Shyhy01_65450 [Streptomyces hygroscopicus subsp. hygroscopicus]|nr:hypothetical protein Shyhy01_65450 [Streptomyces hygroscopicus subsp. hygroscopicus]